MTTIDRVWLHANVATMRDGDDPYGIVTDGAVAVTGGRIVWVGATDDLPPEARASRVEVVDLGGRWITPGLIDCHTHLVFGGDRSHEFERRLAGVSYEQIAREGGGILSTVRATRAADLDTLVRGAAGRAAHLAAEGVTTLEVKSGYGADAETELRQLRAARALEDQLEMRVRATFLALHALPPEFADDRAGFVDLMVEEVLPVVGRESLADAVDAFLEGIAFNEAECARLFEAARGSGLDIRVHADQLSDSGGASLAARFGARSADHLEYTSAAGVAAMAEAGTIAVLLPGAFHYLREHRRPPVPEFRAAGVPMAVATDANPGSSPLLSIQTAMSLAGVLFGLTPAEALGGVTRTAARVLGLESEIGTIEPAKCADLAIWEMDHPREMVYWMGRNPCVGTVRKGEPTASAAG